MPRPQKSNTPLPIYDSIAQCAAATGIPAAILKRAKRSGCAAFVSTRVHLDKLLPFLFTDADSGLDWKSELSKWQALLKKLEHQRKSGELVEVAGVRVTVSEFAAKLVGTMRQRFENEMPAALVGLDVAGVRVAVKAAVDQFCGDIEAFCLAYKTEETKQ